MAVLGSIAMAVYQGRLTDAAPEDVDPETLGQAQDTIGGATAAAARLPGEVGPALLAAARHAFADGMQAAAWVSAVLLTGAAVLAAAMLRTVPPSDEAPAADGAGERPATG